MIWLWSFVVVLCLILEYFSFELICIWFATSAVISLILAVCGVIWWIQIVCFVFLSIVLIFGLRRICKKILKTLKAESRMLIGVKAKLESDLVENSTGTINIKGQEWLCVGDNGFVGSSGERVEVVKLQDGCVVVKGVKKYKKKKTKNKSM